MDKSQKAEIVSIFQDSFSMPFTGSLAEWAYENVELPTAYAIPGKLDIKASPYLLEPAQSLLDPKIKQVNLLSATQCFAPGTRVLMWNGTIQSVENIKIGDFVIGDDGLKRKVLFTHSGEDELYRIIPKGSYANSYVVSREHIMCLLKRGRNKNISYEDIPLMDFIKKTPYEKKNVYFGYQALINWEYRKVEIDPYFLGLWLGDGTSTQPEVTNMEPEIENWLYQYTSSIGMVISKKPQKSKAFIYRIKNKSLGKRNPIITYLRDSNLLNNKHIPNEYLVNDRQTRLELLAGIIDTDGYRPTRDKSKNTGEITFTSEQLSNDVVLLCRSLGFRTSIKVRKTKCQNGVVGKAYRICLYGNLWEIPTKVIRKQWNEEILYNIPKSYGFNVEHVGRGKYYGFQVDGNGRFLLSDCSVVHNTGKTLLSEAFIPFIVAENSGPVLKLHQTDDVSNIFVETRLAPLLENCKPIKPFLSFKRYSLKKTGAVFPHMAIKCAGAKENMAHGLSIRYLLMDECHVWDIGLMEKFIARTTAFAGRRKIMVTSQPNQAGSELEKYFNLGKIYEWQWKCPCCGNLQPWYWSKQRTDLSYAGVNWDTVLLPDGETTDIAKSAATAWLECFHCKHQIPDNVSNRRMLNDTGEYVCIKSNGDPEIVSYTWPGFVNINMPLSSYVVQYLNAKKLQRITGLNEDMITFVNQVLGKFYKAEQVADTSKILRGEYSINPEERNNTSVRFLGVDCQRKGLVKYYVIREFDKNGNESRRIDYGICRTFEEIDDLAKKWGISYPCVAIDSGDGEMTTQIYQECVKHGQVIKLPNNLFDYTCWTPMKGSDKLSFIHPDKTIRYYAPAGKGDTMFPNEHKLRGIPAPFVLWSNYSVKTILANLRDNKVSGVKWLVDKIDSEYEKQMYSEGMQTVLDKKTGQTVTRWMKIGEDNHWWDCECMVLAQAMRAGVFSATKVDEEQLKKVIDNKKPDDKKIQ